MPSISVIVPVYKAEPYLQRCVDSILNQTFTDLELILVDDGSPDNCPMICDEYAEKDCRITVVHQLNQGQSIARAVGITVAKADWICFVDSDDMIHPQMLEHMHLILQDTGAGIVACAVDKDISVPDSFWESKTDVVTCHEANEEGLIAIHDNWKYCYWVVWGKLIRKELIQNYPMTPGRIYEDNAIVFRWLYEAGTIAYTDATYYFYQINPASITQSPYSLKNLDWLWALKEQVMFYRCIGYRILDKKFTARYLIESVWAIDKCVKQINHPEMVHAIRYDMRTIKRSIRLSSLPLTTEQKKQVWRTIYPCLARYTHTFRKLLRYFRRIIGKLKRCENNDT